MERVLFVCVGNISRSSMMQAVLQQHLGDGFLVESAGLTKALAGRPADHRSVACMKERGIDLSGIGSLDVDQDQWIVCVGHEEAEQVRSLLSADDTRLIVAIEPQGDIPDPWLRERVRSSEEIEDVVDYLRRPFLDDSCAVVASHRTLIRSILRSIEPSFGFAEWRAMATPDVFSLASKGRRPIAFECLR